MSERLDRAVLGDGGILLVAGEAGVGKTRLLDDLTGSATVTVLRGAASQDTTPAYGPLVSALRSHLRVEPSALEDCGPLGEHLRVLLPELGPAPEGVDVATLREAIRCALVSISEERGALLVLDDLQWADAATLEFLTGLGLDSRGYVHPRRRRLPLGRAATRASAAENAKRVASHPRAGRVVAGSPQRSRLRSADRAHPGGEGLAAVVPDDPRALSGTPLLRRGAGVRAVRRGQAPERGRGTRAGRGERRLGSRDGAGRRAASPWRAFARGAGGGRSLCRRR